MNADSASALETSWIGDASPLRIESDQYEELRVRDRGLVLLDWAGEERSFVESDELFGAGPLRALVVRDSRRPMTVVLAGEEGCELLRLEVERPAWSRLAELPRFPNDVGGMCRLQVLSHGETVLLLWELGVLALGQTLELQWRQDLEWNHRVVHFDDEEIWFDLLYESDELPQQIGERPWGFSVIDGRELFDRTPPA